MAKDRYVPRDSPEAGKKIGACNGDPFLCYNRHKVNKNIVNKFLNSMVGPSDCDTYVRDGK